MKNSHKLGKDNIVLMLLTKIVRFKRCLLLGSSPESLKFKPFI